MIEDKIKEQEIMSHSAYYEVLHEDDYERHDRMEDPIAFKATKDPDNMHYHQTMSTPDRREFIRI